MIDQHRKNVSKPKWMWNIPNAYSSVMTFQVQCEYRTVGGDDSGPEDDGEDHDSQKGEANSDENRQD